MRTRPDPVPIVSDDRRGSSGRHLTAPLGLAACFIAAGGASLLLGQDANWDLRNYHYHNPWALLNGRRATDIIPAQLQTFYNPLPDLPFYFLASALPPRGVALAMAVPAAVSAFFLVKIAALLFDGPDRVRRIVLVAAAAAIGLTGAVGLSVIGSTMNEWHATAFVMPALYLAAAGRRRGLAGFLAGFGAGVKLAYAPYAVALVAAMLAQGPLPDRVRRAGRVAIFVSIGWLAIHGAWSASLWIEYGNPVFPFYNAIFRSADWLPENYRLPGFGPRRIVEWIAFPVYFASADNALVAELPFRDYRLAAAWGLGVAALGALAARFRGERGTVPPPWRAVLVFTLVAYVLWMALFSYCRYAVPLELLSGVLVVGGVAHLVRARAAAMVAASVVATLLVAGTRPMQWDRVAFGARYFEVSVPKVEDGAMVMLGGGEPMSYVLPFFAHEARFVSPWNNLLFLGQASRLARHAEATVRAHRGPLYVLETKSETKQKRDLLRYLGLARGACEPIRSNIDRDALRLCKLQAEGSPR